MAEWVACQTTKQEFGGSNPGILPLLKHTCGDHQWLICWHYTLAKINAPDVNLHECISSMPLQSVNKFAHSGFKTQRRTSPEVQNRSIGDPTKGHVSNKN